MLFDLDGTLWRLTSPPDFVHITKVQALQVQPLLPASMSLPETEAMITDFWRFFSQTDAAEDADLTLRELDPLALAAKFLRLRLPLAGQPDSEAFWQAMYVPADEFGQRLFDDTLAVISTLRERGLRTGIITNRVFANLDADFAAYGLGGEIDVLVSSCEVGFRKPHPAAFDTALQRLGVTPDEALMIGDNYAIDVLGAERLGIRAVLKLNDRDDSPDWRSKHKIRSLSELPSLLDKLT